MLPISLTELRRDYRRRIPVETLVVQRPDGKFFLRFVVRRKRKEFFCDSEPFSAANDADAARLADSLQYQVLNDDLLTTLQTAPEIVAARLALEAKIGRILDAVPVGTPDVVTNRSVGFAKDNFQPLLFFWSVTERNAYRPRYEPEVTQLIETVNRCLDRDHPGWRTPEK